MSIYSENTMLKAVSMLGRARSLRRISAAKSLKLLEEAIELMQTSIDMDPSDIESRKYRLRHLLGVSMNSPRTCLNEVQEDLKFFKDRFDILNYEDRAYYLSALGEYTLYMGDKEEAISILQGVLDNYKDSSFYEYTFVLLDALLED